MSRKLRVFISSTMKDLPNERYAVFEKLKSFNFEPVMAEELPAAAEGSWLTIKKEIRQCEIFVVVSGARYGWVPDVGPEAGRDLSVTHLEFKEAQRLNLPILVFLQRLPEGMNRETEEAKRLAQFRTALKDWKDGYFVTKEFGLAVELADQVGQAVMNLLFDKFWQDLEEEREEKERELEALRERIAGDGPLPAAFEEPDLPPELVEAVASRRAVLFAGAGFSLSAGFPSALLFTERLKQIMRDSAPDYNPDSWSGTPAAISTDFEATLGRQSLEATAAALTSVLPHVLPTYAHREAVRLFDYIITTNFDTLFEKAGAQAVIFQEPDDERLPAAAVLKLHGSADAPSSLVLIEREVLTLDMRRPRLWGAVLDLLRTRPALVIGSSLRDPSLIRLFTEAGDKVSGYFIGPGLGKTAAARLGAWNLQCIDSGADPFFTALARALLR
jgi:hypothetical protein